MLGSGTQRAGLYLEGLQRTAQLRENDCRARRDSCNREVVMPARDIYHQCVRNALIKDGWTITHDPYTLSVGGTEAYIDLGAERLIAAERGTERIAVETKSFVGASEVRDLEVAVGQ
jgi:hypothetical protein